MFKILRILIKIEEWIIKKMCNTDSVWYEDLYFATKKYKENISRIESEV